VSDVEGEEVGVASEDEEGEVVEDGVMV